MPRAFLIKKKRAAAGQQHASASADFDHAAHPHSEDYVKSEDSSVEEKERAAGMMELEGRRTEAGSEVEYSSEEDTRSASSHSAELLESPSEVRHPASSPEPQQQHPTDLSMRAASPAFYGSPRCSSPHRQHARASTPPRDRSPLVAPIQSHSPLRHHLPVPNPCVPSPRPIASSPRVSTHRNSHMSESPVETSHISSSPRHFPSAYHQHQQRVQSPVCVFPARQRRESSPQRDSPSARRNQASPQPVSAPTKRPSDFSTAFLLSRPSDNKQARSPGQVSPPFQPYGHRRPSPAHEDRPSMPERKSGEFEKIPTISLPTKYSPPCLSVSSWLETHHANMPDPNSLDLPHRRISKTSECLSPEGSRQSLDHEHFRSHVSLRHDDGFSAFRRNSGHEERMVRDALASEKTSRPASSEATSRHAPSPHERRMLSPPTRDRMLASSPPPRDRMLVSPRVFTARDGDGNRHALDRRLPSPSRVLTTPEKLFAARLFPPGSLALPNPGDMRRGTSTSPAHSERTSSGSESPAAISPDSSPTQLPRYPGDLPWGQTASSAGPFLHPGLPHPSQHPLFPMGLRYLPGLPLPKPLPDLALPMGYPKSLSDGLASAFRSTRPPFVHPAAAAYYSSMHSSMPYPFAFSPPGGEGPRKVVSEEVQQAGLERLEALKALRKSSYEPLAAFQSAQPSAAGPAPSSQQGHCVSPVAAAAVLSPRANPPLSGSASLLDPATGRPSEASDLPLGITVHPTGMGLEGRMGVGMMKRTKEHEPVRYQCEACSKSYSTFSGLSKHKQFHCAAQVKKEFSCKYCDKTYVSLGALKMHIRTHTLPCKCSVCGKAFSRPWLLQGHVRTHTGEKPFSCTHCARAFADRSNLRAHLQTHSHVKKYNCRACSKTFSRMSLLLKHEDGCCPSMV